MRASFLLLTLLLAGCFQLKAQEQALKSPDLSFTTGLNFSRTEVEGTLLRPLARPFFGLIYEKKIKQPISLLLSFSFFSKASLYDPAFRLEQKGLELGIGAQWKFDDLALQGGLLFGGTIQDEFQLRYDVYNFIPPPIGSDYANLQPYLGIQFKLLEDVDLTINQSFAIGDQPSSNLQFGIRIRINGRNKGRSYRQQKKLAATQQITELQKGVLLVRMKNPQLSIEAMKKNGLEKEAKKLSLEVDQQNRLIAQGFEKHYDFSKVYFFYSEHSNAIRNRDLDGILLNEQLEKDSSIKINEDAEIFTAEFGEVGGDSIQFYDYTTYEGGGAFQNKAQDHFYGSQDIGFDALVISDDQFNQLSSPFPYYSRWMYPAFSEHPEMMLFFPPITIPYIFTHYRIEKAVERLNARLHNYYLKVEVEK